MKKEASRKLGCFFASPDGSIISDTETGHGSDQRLSIASVGNMPDILSTLGQLAAMVPSIWLPSPTLQVTSATFGHERKM